MLPSSLVCTSCCLQSLLREGTICQHLASRSLGELGWCLLGCDQKCLIPQPELAAGLQAGSGVIDRFSLRSSVVPGGWKGGCCEDGASLCLLGDRNAWPMDPSFMGILG